MNKDNFKSRSTVYSNNGIVCSTSPQAASTGINILSSGGNAYDAAIAVAAVECVTIPGMCGFGGEVFSIFYDAKTGITRGLTSTGAAPKQATSEYFISKGFSSMPDTGPLSVSPPGELAAYKYINENYGTLKLADLIGPAINFAENGHPISPRAGKVFQDSKNRLKQFPSSAKIFLKPDGNVYKEGDLFKNNDLANTLKFIRDNGIDSFYKGEIAEKIIKEFKSAGGILDKDSFLNQKVEVYEPIITNYRGYTVAENRPPSQGMLLLEMLNIVENFDLSSYKHLDPNSIHLMIEAKKRAFADRNHYLADTKIKDVPLEILISKEFAKVRKSTIDINNASLNINPGPIISEGTDTSYFCIIDKEGNAVSFIHSLYSGFGSAFVAEGTGIVFNNRQQGFRLNEPKHPNNIEPGKRPMHTLNAYIVLKENKPIIISGTPGADFQPQGNLQIITSIIDYNLDPQQAIDSPRWYSIPGTHPPEINNPYLIQVEPNMPKYVTDILSKKGHSITWGQEGISHGIVQLICVDQKAGIFAGASDSRGDGYAAAL
ncbi:MAG: gamma-glutamyltransferase [SAR202 cluster bacterium]|nr:gamma-glutamyltransferase [SAR202 cluster bacterium]